MIQMITGIEVPDHDDLGQDADQHHDGYCQQDAKNEGIKGKHKARADEGADHVERPVRQVDEVHDAEDQRQSGGEQKQQHTQLQAVHQLCH